MCALPEPLDPDHWEASRVYLRGFSLFVRGYYWEAHEAWEGLWIAAGRVGALAELLKALIKLAASGVKVRQGLGHQASAFGAKAGAHIAQARALSDQEQLCGIDLSALSAFADDVSARGDLLTGGPEAAVMVVFDRALPEPSAQSKSS